MNLLRRFLRGATGKDHPGRWRVECAHISARDYGYYEIHEFTVTNTGPGPTHGLAATVQPGKPKAGMTPVMLLPSDAQLLRQQLLDLRLEPGEAFTVPVAILRTDPATRNGGPLGGLAVRGSTLTMTYLTGRAHRHTAVAPLVPED